MEVRFRRCGVGGAQCVVDDPDAVRVVPIAALRAQATGLVAARRPGPVAERDLGGGFLG